MSKPEKLQPAKIYRCFAHNEVVPCAKCEAPAPASVGDLLIELTELLAKFTPDGGYGMADSSTSPLSKLLEKMKKARK